MRELIKQIVHGLSSLKLEGQQDGYILLSGQEPDTKQRVSIKVVPRLLSGDSQTAARFRTLSQTIRQLNHPSIAAVRRVGEQSGLPYLITRAIEKGQFLATKLDQPWAVDAASDLVMQVGRALEHAYSKGIVHGSLSPQTIAVQDDGRVTVTDFGLAQMQSLAGVDLRQATSPYLAPERAAGQAPDPRGDVYSLASIVYSLLARRSPLVVQGQVLPPGRFNAEVPPEMDAVLVKALAPNPNDRYPDVKSFLAAFGAVTLVPVVKATEPKPAGTRCARCGAQNQVGRFCRKCGSHLEQVPQPAKALRHQVKATEPIQVTKVDVGQITIGSGVQVHETVITQPIAVVPEDLGAQFPAPLDMPQLDMTGLWPVSGDQSLVVMPEPPAMPVIDWAQVAPPIDSVPTIDDVATLRTQEPDEEP